MALNNVINSVSCGSSVDVCTGLKACGMDMKRIVTLEITPKGYNYLSGSTTLAGILEEQQKEKIIILPGVLTYTDNSADPTIVTRDGSGQKIIVGEIAQEFQVTFDNGINFWKELRKLNSQGLYNLALYDVDGTKFFTQKKNGDVQGFGLNMLFTKNYKGSDGTVASEEMMMFQYKSVSDSDNIAWVAGADLDFDSTDLTGINCVDFEILPVLSGATSLTFAALLSDKTSYFEGLTIPNIKVTKNGGAIVPSAISGDAATKTYTITIPAVVGGDVYTVQTWDSVLSTRAINITNSLYKSDIATVTV